MLESNTGVSCVKSYENLLIVGCRKRDPIYVYDVRNREQPLFNVSLQRGSQQNYSNQRFYFDIDEKGLLFAGNPDG